MASGRATTPPGAAYEVANLLVSALLAMRWSLTVGKLTKQNLEEAITIAAVLRFLIPLSIAASRQRVCVDCLAKQHLWKVL